MTLSMVSHKNFNLNASEGFVMILTSKLITCFIDNFTLINPNQLLIYSIEVKIYIGIGPRRRSALNMRFVDGWPSKMQGE
jgi:hypothetical protein